LAEQENKSKNKKTKMNFRVEEESSEEDK